MGTEGKTVTRRFGGGLGLGLMMAGVALAAMGLAPYRDYAREAAYQEQPQRFNERPLPYRFSRKRRNHHYARLGLNTK